MCTEKKTVKNGHFQGLRAACKDDSQGNQVDRVVLRAIGIVVR